MTATRPKGTEAARVLVIHTAFLGDIVLATPVLAALRAKLPKAEISILTTPAGAKLLTPNPWGVHVIPFDKRGKEKGVKGFWHKAKKLRAFRPDLVFCLHRSFRSVLLAKFAGGESWGFAEAAGAWMLKHRVSREGAEFEAQKNLRLVENWSGRTGFSPYPKLISTQAEEDEAAALLSGMDEFVVMAPSSVWATKRWPAEKFARLADQLWREQGIPTVVVGSDVPEDRDAAARLLAEVKVAKPLNLCGKTSLGALKSVLSKARLVISNDSSPLHMGIAMGRPVVGVFGPTVRELGFFPLAPEGRAAVAEVKGLACRPCGLHGHDRCPQGHFRCMLDLDEARVYEEAVKLLCP